MNKDKNSKSKILSFDKPNKIKIYMQNKYTQATIKIY